MKITWTKDKYAILTMAAFSLIMFLVAILTHGTGDSGDSIMHYLFARFAFVHPENFLNHWAKPFYVLIMCPFAQFGFMGAKLFNTALSCISVWFTYLIARELKYKWALFVFVIALFFKTFMVVAFSGLTEPLNDALISIAIYLAFTRRYISATIIMSFLPFVRSEGLFLCATFSLYLILMRQWKVLPLLLLGHIVYSVVGYPYYKDFLWVFHQIPYGYHDTHYGHGGWLSFAKQMPTIAGVVNCALLCLGVIITLSTTLYFLIQKKWSDLLLKPFFLVLIFLVFFFMHTTFWALGIFGSFGLIRVFIAIGCVMILIMLSAIEYVDLFVSKWVTWHASLIALVLIILFPIYAFGKSPYSYNKYDFGYYADQVVAQEIADYVKQNYPDYKNRPAYIDAVFIVELLDYDFFDEKKCTYNDHLPKGKNYPDKSIIIWDIWYSKFEHNTSLESLRNNQSLQEIKSYEKVGLWADTFKVVLFVRKD